MISPEITDNLNTSAMIRCGSGTLVAGVLVVSPGANIDPTNARIFLTPRSWLPGANGGAAATNTYQFDAVSRTSSGFTITAKTQAGATQTTDVSIIDWMVIGPRSA